MFLPLPPFPHLQPKTAGIIATKNQPATPRIVEHPLPRVYRHGPAPRRSTAVYQLSAAQMRDDSGRGYSLNPPSQKISFLHNRIRVSLLDWQNASYGIVGIDCCGFRTASMDWKTPQKSPWNTLLGLPGGFVRTFDGPKESVWRMEVEPWSVSF